jgi:molybdenum cofactor cytidylyltransferase
MPVAQEFLAGLVLAAGGSSRLGMPKQLLTWRDQPLVCHAVEQSLAVCGAGVVVVAGAHAAEVSVSLQGYPVTIIHNPHWQSGAATSLSAGISALRSRSANGVLISLCDQPLVLASDLAHLADIWQTAPHLPAASQYRRIVGVPAIFPAGYFDRLAGLQGDVGARALLRSAEEITILEMPSAAMDIDTPEDMERLRSYDH